SGHRTAYWLDTLWRENHGVRAGRPPRLAPAPPPGPSPLPSPSRLPILVAVGLVVAAAGALVSVWIVVAGLGFAVLALFRFALEHHANLAHAHQDGVTGVDHRKLGMWAFLSSECMFFGTLIAVYLAYKGRRVDRK